MRNYNNELNALQEQLIRKEKIESMLRSLYSQLTELRDEERRLFAQCAKEQKDVDRLESASLAAFFYAMIGKKDEKLDKERAQAYAASVKHAAAKRQVEAAEYDIHSLETQLQSLSGIKEKYDRLFAEKAAAVKAENPAFGAELCRLQERLGYATAQMKELDEAVDVGRRVLSQISSIEGSLDSANGWGTWDILGGGLVSDLAKHSRLDEAQAQIDALQNGLRHYRTELADITVQVDIQAQVDGFLRFADYFFDGLFADWAVLDSIHSAQRQIRSTRHQVEGIQQKLESMKSTMQAEETALNESIRDLVLRA